jgi:hypothetical protein
MAAPNPVINAVLEELRAAVRCSAAPALLEATVGAMRAAANRDANVMLHLMPILSHMSPGIRATILRSIVRRFEDGNDGSVFGLVNAVTSVARDTADPETRWRLEELGGGMLARLPERPKPLAPSADAGVVETVFASATTAPRLM